MNLSTVSRNRIYAGLLILGASILVFRSAAMIRGGSLKILVPLVALTIFLELYFDLCCLLCAVAWLISASPRDSSSTLRYGAVCTVIHALRVFIFALGRFETPLKDFDVRLKHRANQGERWNWPQVYFASIMSILGLFVATIIRNKQRYSTSHYTDKMTLCSWPEDRRGFEILLYLDVALVFYALIMILCYNALVKGCILSVVGAIFWLAIDCASRPATTTNGGERPLLVCLGDSLTHGHVSASVVDRVGLSLTRKSGKDVKLGIVNAGQNNVCSWTVYHKRVDRVLQYDPDYVLVWIGTNDVRCIYKKLWSRHMEFIWCLPGAPSLEGLETNVRGIVQTLLKRSPRLQIGLCTLPPMGEIYTNPANTVIRKANAVLFKVATTCGDQCTLVPVYEALELAIRTTRWSGWKPPVDYFVILALAMSIFHHVFGLSWNALSYPLGNAVLSDSLHLNETGADIVADIVAEWLLEKGISGLRGRETKQSKKGNLAHL